MRFQITGMGILLLFYGCYIAKAARQRGRGIRTDQTGKGKTGSAKAIELTMKAAAYMALAAEAVSIALNTGSFPIAVRIAGAFIGVVGTAVFIVSVLTMQDSWRAGVSKTEETKLVTGGIYQLSRNPAFLGFDLVYIGIAVMFFNWVLLLASIFAAAMLHLQIVNVEERFLAEAFGEEYLKYSGKVRRYLGRKR